MHSLQVQRLYGAHVHSRSLPGGRILAPNLAVASPGKPNSRGLRTSAICKAATQNLYEVLGLSQGASEREIKAAYRKRALKLHPDVNKAPDAQQRFMEAKMAFETLSDPAARSEYDRRIRMGFGSASDWRANRGGSSSASNGSRTGSSGYSGWKQQQPVDNYTFEDLMRDLDKEFASWTNELKAKRGGKEPKTLWDELNMLGEEFVDFLEGAVGEADGKATSGPTSTSSSSSSTNNNSTTETGPRRPLDEFERLWSKYADPEPVAGTSSGAGTSSSSGTSANRTGSSSTGSGSSNSSSARKSDDDIDAMLAELKRKVKRDG